MESHMKVARVHRVISWLCLVFLAAIAYLLFAPPANINRAAFAYSLLIALAFLAHHVTARGALEAKPWARIASIVLAVLMLVAFPIGTIVGIYLLVNTLRPWGPQAGAPAVV